MKKSFNQSTEKFCKVEFYFDFLPHEIDPRAVGSKCGTTNHYAWPPPRVKNLHSWGEQYNGLHTSLGTSLPQVRFQAFKIIFKENFDVVEVNL